MNQLQHRPQGKEQDNLPVNDYDFWERALAGEEVGGSTLPIHEGEAHSGFWRRRSRKGGPFVPVAIWRENGVCCLVDGKPADASEQWSYCCRFPISEAHYRERIATGKWFDEDDAVTESLSPPPAGHNQADKIDSLKDQIESALKGVGYYAEVKDDVTASKAQSLRSRLLDLHRDADKERDTLKRPYLDAERAVDAEWMPLVKSAKVGADTIKKALDAHETAKFKAEQARIAAQRLKDAEEAAKYTHIGAEPEPAPEPLPTPVAAPIKGAYGRAASVKVFKVAIVKDQDAAYLALKSQPELTALIQKLAQKMADAGFSLAGVEIEEQRKVN